MAERPDDLTVVITTVPDAAAGERLARQLVEERLIACANLIPGLTSVYRWEGAVQTEAELLMLMKTPAAGVERLFARAAELHPYEVPELLALPVATGLEAYCRWVAAEVGEREE
ncbi:MAG: divalent-cation tolerance protein CutA [Gemmatimonadetes bacterium]|nr:divalent-cation tolerance protein CutA [Gemmatimonadota bacterium]